MNINRHCYYCGILMTTARGGKKNPLPENYLTRDHLTPIFRGGPKSISARHTVQCCNKCNREKGCLTFEEFRAVVAYRKNRALVSPGTIFAGEKSFWNFLVDTSVVYVIFYSLVRLTRHLI